MASSSQREFFSVTAMRFLSVGCRPMGASTVPESSRNSPRATASYTRERLRSVSCSESARCAKSFFAAMMRPDVSLSTS